MGEFSKPKVLIDQEEYEHLKGLQNQEYEIEKRISDGILPYQVAFGCLFKHAVTNKMNTGQFDVMPVSVELFWKLLKEDQNLVVTGSKQHQGITIPIISSSNPSSSNEKA